MGKIIKTIVVVVIISVVGIGIFNYIFSQNEENNKVDDQTNIENIVKNEATTQENVEGTVISKRTTDPNGYNTKDQNNG